MMSIRESERTAWWLLGSLIAALFLFVQRASGIEIVAKQGEAYYLAIPMLDEDSPKDFKTGLTVTYTCYCKTGAGAWATQAIADTFTEVAAIGIYEIDIASGEISTHDQMFCKLEATGAPDSFVLFRFYPNDVDDCATPAEVDTECDEALTTYDGPTDAEMEARTKLTADYFAPADDTVVNVTNVATLTGHTVQTGDTYAQLPTYFSDLAITETTGRMTLGSTGTNAINALSIATSAIGASEIAVNAIGASELAADAAAEIRTEMDGESTQLAAILADTDDIGVAGAGLTAVPWNAAWDEEVESEANDALVALGLDHLVAVADADDPVDGSIIAEMASDSGDWSTFTPSTDSLEALADAGGGADAGDITYTPAVAANWNTGDPGNVDGALNELAGNLNPYLPEAAPVLDDISWSSSEGVSGKNTWNSANPITGYIEADDAVSVNNSGDALDITMGTSGNEHGVMDHDTVADKIGVLNDDVAASDNWPANSFGPGGSDGGDTNTLYLVLNDTTLHTVDLLTFDAGDSLNGNGSGFTSLLAATPVYFPGGSPTFPPRKYRTGSWKVDAADMVKGYNVIWVDHVTAGGTLSTNVEEFLLDDNDTATSFSAESLSDYASGASTKHLSGVEYHNGTITATYNCTFDNAYRDTFRTGTAVTHPTDTNCSVADGALSDSGGDEAKQVVWSPTATVDVTRITGGNLVIDVRVDRTVQTDSTSSGATQSQCLVDRDTQSNGNEAHYYADEGYRIRSNQDFNTNLTPSWDETESLVDAGTAGYTTGIQVTEDRLYYPGGATVDDYSSLTSGPAGNPDYSTGVTGVRYLFGQFYNATGRSNFAFNIQGSATLVNEGTLSTSTNEVSIAIRLPSQTGWMDIDQDYSAGQWGSTSESATATATVGCYAEGYGADKTIPTSALGWTVGTKTTDDSYDNVYYRVSVPQGWTGYLDSITVNWGAQ